MSNVITIKRDMPKSLKERTSDDSLFYRWRNTRTNETAPFSGPTPRGKDWTLETAERLTA